MSGASAVSAFNSLLVTFVSELGRQFPTDPRLAVAATALQAVIDLTPQVPVHKFLEFTSPYRTQIIAMDVSVFDLIGDSEFVPGSLLASSSHETKTAALEYVRTLLLLAVGIATIPAHVLQGIERVASMYAESHNRPGAGAGPHAAPALPPIDVNRLVTENAPAIAALMQSMDFDPR